MILKSKTGFILSGVYILLSVLAVLLAYFCDSIDQCSWLGELGVNFGRLAILVIEPVALAGQRDSVRADFFAGTIILTVLLYFVGWVIDIIRKRR